MAPVRRDMPLIVINGLASGTTNGAGVLAVTFPEPFPTACVGVVFMPNQNKAAPVLEEANVRKDGYGAFFAGAASQPRSIQYIAFGY